MFVHKGHFEGGVGVHCKFWPNEGTGILVCAEVANLSENRKGAHILSNPLRPSVAYTLQNLFFSACKAYYLYFKHQL